LVATALLAAAPYVVCAGADYLIQRQQTAIGMQGAKVSAFGDNAFYAGRTAGGDLVVRRFGSSVGADLQLLITAGALGAPITVRDLAAVSDSDVIVVGSLSINSADRMFIGRIHTAPSPSIVWSITEPPRSSNTVASQIVVDGDRIYVSAELQGSAGVLALGAADGVEAWRSTVPATMLRRCGVEVFPNRTVYLLAHKDGATRPVGFMRALNTNGTIQWSQQLSTQTIDQVRLDPAGASVYALGTDSFVTPQVLTLFRFNALTGAPQGSKVRSGGFPITAPLMEMGVNRVLVRSADITNANTPNERFVWVIAQDFSGDAENAISPRGTDVASCAAPDRAPHFVSRAETIGGFVAEISRESAPIRDTFPPATQFDDVATNGDQLFVCSAAGADTTLTRLIQRPVTSDDFFEALSGPLTVAAPGFLANDFGAKGGSIILTNLPTKGAVTLAADGSFQYTPTKAFTGEDTFGYKVNKNGMVSSSTVTLRFQPHLKSFFLSSTRVKGGQSVTGKLILDSARIATDVEFPLFDNSPFVSMPSKARILAGQTESIPFTVSTTGVSALVRAFLSSNDGDDNVVEINFLDIDPGLISSIVPTETTIVGSVPASFTITMDGIAPAGGMPFAVTDNSTAIQVPPTVTVPENATQTTFSAPTAVVTSSRTVVVTASANGVSKSCTIAIVGASLSLSPSTLVGGQGSIGAVTLTSNAIVNSVVFALSSDAGSANFGGVPQAVVPVGFAVGRFNVVTFPVVATRTVTISAANGGFVMTVPLTIQAPTVGSFITSPNSLRGGGAFAGLAQLTGKANPNGVVVQFSSVAPALVQVPNQVTVTGGSDVALFVGTTSTVTSSTMVILNATLNGVTRAATIVLTP